jgi:hypothetical protein
MQRLDGSMDVIIETEKIPGVFSSREYRLNIA